MKASVKLREEEGKTPLLRAKVPISVLGFPLVSSAAAGDHHDLSFHLRSALPSGPSLKLSYHPNPNPNSQSPHPFSLSLKSGIGLFGSPHRSPLLLSAHLSPQSPTPLSFSIQIKPQVGDFSLKKTAVSSPNPNPNPKENGGRIHHPIPVGRMGPTGLEELIAGGVAVAAKTTLPVARRAAVRVRWGVNLPVGTESGGRRRLPYLTIDKISVEGLYKEVEEEGEGKRKGRKEWGDKDLEAVKGMCFWMSREVEELKRENLSVKEGIEMVREKVSEIRRNDGKGIGSSSSSSSWGMEGEGRKNVASPKDATASSRTATGRS